MFCIILKGKERYPGEVVVFKFKSGGENESFSDDIRELYNPSPREFKLGTSTVYNTFSPNANTSFVAILLGETITIVQ
jgi:hypothetical protein